MLIRLVVWCVAALLVASCGESDEESAGSDGAGPEPNAKAVAEPELGSIDLSDLKDCGQQPKRDGYLCGSLEVPFEREDPSYGTTEIGFAVLPHLGPGESKGAIFAVEGGPGYPSTGTAQAYRVLFDDLLQERDLVLVDQRGQGRSEHFDCPELQRGLGPDALVLAKCAANLGERFISYRTSAAADDIDWVRQALGYEQIALYGDSYGTFLAQSYAYRHADRLEALVLDSAYPTFGEDPWYPSLPRTGVRSLEVACDRDPDCDGDAGERLAKAVQVLRRTDRSALQLIQALIDSAYGPPDTYLRLDRVNRAIIDERWGPWERLVAKGKYGSGSQRVYSRAGEMVVSCNDYPMVWSKESSEPERRAELEEAIENYPKAESLRPFRAREIAMSSGTSYLYCLSFPQPTDIYEPPVDPETQQPTQAPVLVVSGELDDVTTAQEGRRVAAQFPDAEFFLARNAGHVDALYYPNRPAAREIRRFLVSTLP